MPAPIASFSNLRSGLREFGQVTNTYGGYLESAGAAYNLILPFFPDKLELYDSTSGANPILWFRDMAAGTALGGGIGSAGSYGYAYALTPQSVAAYTALGTGEVLFDAVGPSSGVSTTLGQADIVVANAGTYEVNFSVSGAEPNQFAIFVNDVPQQSTVGGSGAGTQQNDISSILTLPAGAVINLVNYVSAAAVTLATTVGGTQPNVTASVTLRSLSSSSGAKILVNGITDASTPGGFANQHLVISAITNVSPPVVTTTVPHNLTTMDRSMITQVIGAMANAVNNHEYVVQVLSPTTFALYDAQGFPIVAPGAYTSGGQVTKISPLLGLVGSPNVYPAPVNGIQNYPPQFILTLGTAVMGAASDIIYFQATKFNNYVNIGQV